MMTFRDSLTDAMRYWEIRRIAYNVALAVVVVAVFAFHWPLSSAAISSNLVQGIFILAVLANVAYCAAYLIDVPAQMSGFSASWKRYRWILFAIGVIFAGIITRFFAEGMAGNAA
jgi:hypothetical protein